MLTYQIQGQNIFRIVSPPTMNFDETLFKKELEELMKKRNITSLKATWTESDETPK